MTGRTGARLRADLKIHGGGVRLRSKILWAPFNMSLNKMSNVSHPDEFYQALIDMHRNLTAEQSQLANARLILLLANHIGDEAVLREAMQIARQGLTSEL